MKVSAISAAAAAMGRIKSAAKTRAAQENGKLGGWPKGRPRKKHAKRK